MLCLRNGYVLSDSDYVVRCVYVHGHVGVGCCCTALTVACTNEGDEDNWGSKFVPSTQHLDSDDGMQARFHDSDQVLQVMPGHGVPESVQGFVDRLDFHGSRPGYIHSGHVAQMEQNQRAFTAAQVYGYRGFGSNLNLNTRYFSE